jgi:hypothetical protein
MVFLSFQVHRAGEGEGGGRGGVLRASQGKREYCQEKVAHGFILHGCMGAWMHEKTVVQSCNHAVMPSPSICMDGWVHGCMNAWMHAIMHF